MIKQLIVTRSIDGSLGGNLAISIEDGRSYLYEDIPKTLVNKIENVIYEYVEKDIDNISHKSRDLLKKKILYKTNKLGMDW